MPAEHVEIESRPAGEAEGHACGCHEPQGDIVLDARTIPHAIRHATIRGAFSAIPVGGSMVLVAPHRPAPLLAQISDDAEGALAVEVLLDEPGECHVRLTRTAGAPA